MLCGPGGNHFLMFANFDRAQISGSVIIYNAQLHLITSSKILLSVKVMTNMQIYWDDLSRIADRQTKNPQKGAIMSVD